MKLADAMASLDPRLAARRANLRVPQWQVGVLATGVAAVSLPTLLLVLRIAIRTGTVVF